MRRILVALSAAAIVMSGAGVAQARPVVSEEPYYGPGHGTASSFAGARAKGCVDTYKVYGERKKYCPPKSR